MITRTAAIGAVILWAASAAADPNPDIEAYCRSTTTSFVKMANCITAEQHARNLQSCIDALASWPRDKDCPPAWFREAVENMRNNRPCFMAEARQ